MAQRRQHPGGFPRISVGEVAEGGDTLVARYAGTRDPLVREEAFRAFAPLVERILVDFLHSGVPQDDLRQVGYVGLLTALELFDPARGTKFRTYAGHLVRGEMRHFLRDHRDTIRQPRWLHRLNRGIEEAVAHSLAEAGRFPGLEDLAVRLNIREEGLRELLRVREAVRTVSLDAVEEDADVEIDPRLIRHRTYVSFQLPIEDKIILYQAINRLTLLQRRILFYLFFGGFSQIEAARRIGVSQKHISRVLTRTLTRLRILLSG